MCAILALAPTVSAQILQRPIALRNARIITMAGPVIESGTLLLKGDRVTAIGTEVDVPFLAKKLDLTGKTITPGFIDAWSSLGHLGGSVAGDPTSTAWDTFDRYARDDFREALRHGVTTVYVGPGSSPGVAGTGVIVQLVPDVGNAAGVLLEKEAALSIRLGSEQSPIARLKTFNKIRKQFRKAVDYRRSLEDYEEDLKEYEEKLKERREKEEKDKESTKGDEKNGTGTPKKNGKKKPADDKPKPDEDDKPEDDKPEDDKALTVDNARPHRRADNNGEKKPTKEKKKDDKEEDKDEIKKPEKPKPDRASEVLLRAIDRELQVRIEAHRSEDILNALELADEFYLDVTLEGATDGYLVAEAIADAEVPVVLGPVVRSTVFTNNQFRRHSEANAAALGQAGVDWTLGSGATSPRAARFVAANAQLAAAHGASSHTWMATVTTEAARILGIDKRIGRLQPGRQADIVVWSGNPGDPGVIVERVYVAGKLAYVAPNPVGVGR